MVKKSKWLEILGTVFILTFSIGTKPANSQSILQNWFGVTLQLGDSIGGTWYDDAFTAESFIPTLHTTTADYAIPTNTSPGSDWYGDWSTTLIGVYTTYRGQYPTGEEVYDVEAIYFDNDETNIYVVVVTSFPPPPGQQEQRSGYDGLVVSGDLAIDLGLNSPYSDGFSYDYGVNINHEERNISGGNAYDNGSTIGNELYRTSNNDWYVGSADYAVAANGELTSFDPEYSGFTGTQVGNGTVNYTLYDLGGAQENKTDTYVIEVTIPLSLLGDPGDGTSIGIGWVMGCRNDGNQNDAVLRLWGDIDIPVVPVELTSFSAKEDQRALSHWPGREARGTARQREGVGQRRQDDHDA